MTVMLLSHGSEMLACLDVSPSPGLVHYMYSFGGSCPLTEFCQVQNSFCIQVLHSQSVLTALPHGTWAVGVSQTLWRGTRNCRSSSFSTEGATYIPRAAITLGIGPHSSRFCPSRILVWFLGLVRNPLLAQSTAEDLVTSSSMQSLLLPQGH